MASFSSNRLYNHLVKASSSLGIWNILPLHHAPIHIFFHMYTQHPLVLLKCFSNFLISRDPNYISTWQATAFFCSDRYTHKQNSPYSCYITCVLWVLVISLMQEDQTVAKINQINNMNLSWAEHSAYLFNVEPAVMEDGVTRGSPASKQGLQI